ncbi:glycosyltransferase family 4 protein [Methylocystis sp. WRRC1]|uniref:glycosyltransferase family 4 protein n=1 Tax=Methylocystis sp. WRRC1 TaxID=1732014 RepID=UPI001D135181|nr:glycosyltransferase family 4 protein [Methylocystis sp. WRRC1]MCC3244467.1 glycosyltransferase family 4 protein [Methylocystis sp. WRRC1]
MIPAYAAFISGRTRLDLPGFPLRQPLRAAAQIMRLARLIRENRIDTIFSSHLGFLRVAAVLRILTGARAFFHLGLPAGDLRWTVRLSAPFLGGGIAPAAHTKETWLAAGWPRKTLHEIRNYVDTEFFHPVADKSEPRRRLGLPTEKKLIGYIGRIVPEKGVRTLVEAFNQLATTVADVDLILMGRGEPAYRLSLVSNADLRSRIHILPPAPNTQEYFAALDIACVPSECEETFPLAMLEAMSSGLPVVCSDVGMLPKIVGEANRDLVFRAGDALELSHVLARILSAPNMTERGMSLRKRAIEYYGPRDVVDAYERLMKIELAD